jgi:hypothetical protein
LSLSGGNRVAAFLGDPDDAVHVDCHLLHDARTGARDLQGKGASDILRPDAYPASLSEALNGRGEEGGGFRAARLIKFPASLLNSTLIQRSLRNPKPLLESSYEAKRPVFQ